MTLPRHVLRIGLLPPLSDPVTGRAFDHLPCEDAPSMWDEDADVVDKRNAARICRRICPAILPCWARRQALAGRASGVWAGRILRTRREDERVGMIDDPELASWAAAAGVTIRTPDLHGKAAAR